MTKKTPPVGKKAQRRMEAAQRAKSRQRRKAFGLGLGIAIIAATAFMLVGGSTEPALAAEFELDQLGGDTVSLSDYRGKPIALIFMHSW